MLCWVCYYYWDIQSNSQMPQQYQYGGENIGLYVICAFFMRGCKNSTSVMLCYVGFAITIGIYSQKVKCHNNINIGERISVST